MTLPALDPAVEAALRGALALLFLVAAAHKLRDFGAFAGTLADYRMLPSRLTRPAAAAVVLLEATLAPALLLPRAHDPTLLATAALLGAYTLAIGVNLLRGRRHIDCGCSGPALRQPLGESLVARNLLLVALALACLLPVRARPLVWVDAISIAGLVCVLAASYAAANRLIGADLDRLRLEDRT